MEQQCNFAVWRALGWASPEEMEAHLYISPYCTEPATTCAPCTCTAFECQHVLHPVCERHHDYLEGLLTATFYLLEPAYPPPGEEGSLEEQSVEWELVERTINPWIKDCR